MKPDIEKMLESMSDDEVESAHMKDSWWKRPEAEREAIRVSRKWLPYGRSAEVARLLEEEYR